MQEQDQSRTVGRRKLLRRAGTVAAGAAGAGVVGSMVGSPAQAAPGDPVVIGSATNSGGTTTTTLTSGNATNPTLRLENESGSALSVNLLETIDASTAPPGSIFLDEYGDFNAIGFVPGEGRFLTTAYSPTWATMTIPVAPFRWVDTRNAAGRAFLRPGSSFDSAGRLLPKNSNTTPDAIVDLSELFAGGFGAVQANLTVVNPAAVGNVSLWDAGTWPGTSSINYSPTLPALANFTQTVIGEDLGIRVKTNQAVAIILDIVGFVVTDPFWQLAPGAERAINARGGNGTAISRWQKRVPRG
jgi:hypothetical protein